MEKDLYLKIGRPTNTCIVCGVEITRAGKHPSILRPAGSGVSPAAERQAETSASASSEHEVTDKTGPQREDYCQECWQAAAEKDYLGYWMARRVPPKARKIESKKERNAGVLAWFDHLRTRPPAHANLQSQYFLAHLLMKYGVLKWTRTETRDDGQEVIYFRQTGQEDEVAVTAVELDDETSGEIKRKLDEFLLQFANAPETSEAAKDKPEDGDGGGDAAD